jgi:hypothetical protein
VGLPVVADGDLGVDGQPPGDLPVGGVQRAGVLGQLRVRVAWQAEGGQDVAADRGPCPAVQELGLQAAPSGRCAGPDLAALEVAPELLQDAEGAGVPAGCAVIWRQSSRPGVGRGSPPGRALTRILVVLIVLVLIAFEDLSVAGGLVWGFFGGIKAAVSGFADFLGHWFH